MVLLNGNRYIPAIEEMFCYLALIHFHFRSISCGCSVFNVRCIFKLRLYFYICRELQAASGEWINEYARGPPRRDSITKEYLPASDIIKKSIRRSWTISSKIKITFSTISTIFLTLYFDRFST